MLATSSSQAQSRYLARCGKSLEGDTDAEGYPFEGSVQQVLTPVIDTYTEKGSPAVGDRMVRALSRQEGQK